MKIPLWRRWKAFARQAARVQSNILLTILYFVVFVPLALVRRPFTERFGGTGDRWFERSPAPRDVTAARRQF
jgi:hypothetical protein